MAVLNCISTHLAMSLTIINIDKQMEKKSNWYNELPALQNQCSSLFGTDFGNKSELGFVTFSSPLWYFPSLMYS